jgi:outer membrane receptor for ferrienterochelin and colicins
MKVGFHARTCVSGADRLNRFGGGGLVLWAALLVAALESTMVLPASGATVADDYTSLNLEQLMAIPVYSAAKHEQKTSEAPSSVTVITSQDVRAYGWRTLSDLLRSVPGIYVKYTRSYGSMGVRGFDRGGAFGGRILLLINGHRMNDPLYDTAAIMEDFILDLDLIDRVEIVRGPGSTLYGTNAFFAVVNVLTKKAEHYDGFEASGEAGTLYTGRGRLTFGTRSDDGAELLLSASGYASDGKDEVYMPSLVEPDGKFDGVQHHGDGEAATRCLGSYRHGALTVEGFYVGRDKDSPPSLYTVNFLPRHTFDERAFVESRYEHALSSDATLTARLYYDWYKYVGTYLYDVDEPKFVTNVDESIAESVGGELQVSWRPWTGHAATAGFEYRDNYRQAMRNFDVEPYYSVLDIDTASQILSLYLQDEYRPSTRMGITGGVRYDRYDTFGEAVNPRLALVWNPREATTIKLLYGEAFRAPNAEEFYYEEETPDYHFKRNPDLKPEEIRTYEVVWEQQFGHNWRGSFAGFFNQTTDLIDTQTVKEVVNGEVVYITEFYDNMDKVNAKGMEFQADGQLTENTRVSASYTYTNTKSAETGEPLTYAPKHLGKLNLTAPVLPGVVMAGVEAQFTSDRFTDDGRCYNRHWLVNASLFSARWKDHLEGSLSVYNLFAAHYNRDIMGDLEALQDGRLLRVKVTTRF